MKWPSAQDFHEQVQSPAQVFFDAELQNAEPEMNSLGLPVVQSGNFASVYRLRGAYKDWAVRCFLHPVTDQDFRYQALSRFILGDDLPYTVDFGYQTEGMRVAGQVVPILKMEWVEGVSFDVFLRQHYLSSAVVGHMLDSFLEMMREMARCGIAHGDLQHGNVLISNGELRLVDYDAMFVPELSGHNSPELGHRNYQHPKRIPEHFDASLDNFSAWVIYSSLYCLVEDSSLWRRFSGGDECIIFRESDFRQPEQSAVFRYLSAHRSGGLKAVSKIFSDLLVTDPRQVPPLPEIVARLPELDRGNWVYAKTESLKGEPDVGWNLPGPSPTKPAKSSPAWMSNFIAQGKKTLRMMVIEQAAGFNYWCHDFAIAKRQFAEALSLSPANESPDEKAVRLSNLAMCCFHLDQLVESAAHFRAAVATASPQIRPYYQWALARVLWERGEKKEASKISTDLLLRSYGGFQIETNGRLGVAFSMHEILYDMKFVDQLLYVANQLLEDHPTAALLACEKCLLFLGYKVESGFTMHKQTERYAQTWLTMARAKQAKREMAYFVISDYKRSIKLFKKTLVVPMRDSGSLDLQERMAKRYLARYYLELAYEHRRNGDMRSAEKDCLLAAETYADITSADMEEVADVNVLRNMIALVKEYHSGAERLEKLKARLSLTANGVLLAILK